MDKDKKNLLQPYGTIKKKTFSRFDIAAICACIVITVIFVLIAAAGKKFYPRMTTFEKTGPSTLRGSEVIYPQVMVNGINYWWFMVAKSKELPEESVYYGEVKHVSGDKPTEDCEMVSVFDASGQIYVLPDDPSFCCLRLTTSWLKDTLISFYREDWRYDPEMTSNLHPQDFSPF